MKKRKRQVRKLLNQIDQYHVDDPSNIIDAHTQLYGLDNKLGLGIFEDKYRSVNAENDSPLLYSEIVQIEFTEYDKYLIVESIDEKYITALLDEFRELFQIKEFSFEIIILNEFALLKVGMQVFLDFMYLVQRINEFRIGEEGEFVTGILVNRIDVTKSFYVVNESSGRHLNSLVGEDYSNNPFSIYLLDDFSDGDFLGYSKNLEFSDSLELREIIENLKKLDFSN